MERSERVPMGEFWAAWTKVAALSFGGPAGQIAVMHRIAVEEKRWVSEGRFLNALNFCMLLPGPEAQQLATYLGWMTRGRVGGLIAGGLFVLPGFLSILALSVIYALWQQSSVVEGAFLGLKACVIAIVIQALYRLSRKTLTSGFAMALAAAAFAALFLFQIAFPYVIACAAIAGWLYGRSHPDWAGGGAQASGMGKRPLAAPRQPPALGGTAWRQLLGTLVVGALAWLGPIFAIAAWLGPDHVIAREGFFFSRVAMVTFGGAYSVLSYVGQQAVEVYGWLAPGEMLDGLGMAETTPGPLIQVVQFVGFMGAYRSADPLSPMMAGVVGSIATTWATFAPCFVWIFAGAPFVERITAYQPARQALAAIGAAVIGVILNLALWFATHTLFRETTHIEDYGFAITAPLLTSANVTAIAIAAASAFALIRLRWPLLRVVAFSIPLGLVAYYANA